MLDYQNEEVNITPKAKEIYDRESFLNEFEEVCDLSCKWESDLSTFLKNFKKLRNPLDTNQQTCIITLMDIEKLLEDKVNKTDCDQDGSAYIKQLLKRINLFFPNEFDEAIEEIG